jgi:hypothetical protein
MMNGDLQADAHVMLADASWDLPWAPLQSPIYKEMTLGAWAIRWMAPVPQWRYFHTELITAGQYTLLAGDESWMSTAPIESEGQVQHVAAAYGHVVVMGAGLGVVLYNLLRKRQVTHVTLVERDPNVITLLRQAADLEHWDGIGKLATEIGDAFEFQSPTRVDCLYVDIWAKPADPQALADTQRIQRNVQAHTVGWWTQEVFFLRWLEQHGADQAPTLTQYQAWAREIDLPLIEQDNRDYMRCIAQLAASGWYQELRRAEATNHVR